MRRPVISPCAPGISGILSVPYPSSSINAALNNPEILMAPCEFLGPHTERRSRTIQADDNFIHVNARVVLHVHDPTDTCQDRWRNFQVESRVKWRMFRFRSLTSGISPNLCGGRAEHRINIPLPERRAEGVSTHLLPGEDFFEN